MKKTTLHVKLVCLLVAYVMFITSTSCTQDSTEDSIYEPQAKTRTFSPIQKPVVDKGKVTTGPDRDGIFPEDEQRLSAK